MNHSEEHYQRREKFLKDRVTDQIKLENHEWVMSKKEAIASFLGIDKLAELNAQRAPGHWPMKDGPTWCDDLVVDNLVDLGFTREQAIEGMTKKWGWDWNNG